jgi:hypothetical protein
MGNAMILSGVCDVEGLVQDLGMESLLKVLSSKGRNEQPTRLGKDTIAGFIASSGVLADSKNVRSDFPSVVKRHDRRV